MKSKERDKSILEYVQCMYNNDVNRYAILIIIKKDWELKLDKNFMNLFGFSKYVFNEGYHRSDLIPNVDKVKFLKIYCNLIDNRE